MKRIMMMLTVSLFTGQLMAQSAKNTAPPPPPPKPPIHKLSTKVPLPPPPSPTPPVVKAAKMPAPPPTPPTISRTSKKLNNKKETIQFTPPVIVKNKEK